MPLMEWTGELGVNVKEIDEQHKKLIGLINKLHDAMLAGQGKQALEGTLQELAAYTVYHFGVEEKYMQQFKYPGYLRHKAAHTAFVKKVTDFQDDFSHNRLGVTLELMNFLKDWVNNHIRETDKQYSALFKEKGLA
jgi:hemerythrin